MIFAPPALSSILENDLVDAAIHDNDGVEVTWDSYVYGDDENEDDVDDGNLADNKEDILLDIHPIDCYLITI